MTKKKNHPLAPTACPLPFSRTYPLIRNTDVGAFAALDFTTTVLRKLQGVFVSYFTHCIIGFLLFVLNVQNVFVVLSEMAVAEDYFFFRRNQKIIWKTMPIYAICNCTR